MNNLVNELREKLNATGSLSLDVAEILEQLERKADLAEKIEKCLYDSDLYLVYKHTDPFGKVYVGITQNHPQTRWNEGGGYESQRRFYKAIQKYGWINFKHEIIAAALTKEEAVDLENELIILNRSYDERYGYNTKVQMQDVEKQGADLRLSGKTVSKSTDGCLRKRKHYDLCEISNDIVKKYSIKTIGDIIYYTKDSELTVESENPFVEKVLVAEYNLPVKYHSEVFQQIRILSRINQESLSEREKEQIKLGKKDSIDCWMENTGLTVSELMKIHTVQMYEEYMDFCKKINNKELLGKKQFFKAIEEKFDLMKKQKADQKRYFVKR